MTKKRLFIIWAVYYSICAGLGFIPSPSGALYGFLFCVSLGFFVPGGMLLYRAAKAGDRKTLKLFRNLSAASLVLTMLFIVLNFASVGASELAGNVLYVLLVLVSVPMVCGQVWIVSLFLWACMLMLSLRELRKKK